MPHATDAQPLVNGDKANSKFVNHITSYPVVSDSVNSFKSHPYGRKSIDLADSAYQRFAKPVEPYLETPYSYAKPYLGKADELADSGLGHVESHFPIVKQDTNTIIDTGKSYIFWPFKLANDGKDYVLSTYNDEYQKTAKHNGRGSGLVTGVLAIISTELKIASDALHTIADVLGPKYEESKKKGSDLLNDVQRTAEQYKQIGQEKLGQAQKEASKAKDDAQKEASKAKDDAQREANKVKDEAHKKAQK